MLFYRIEGVTRTYVYAPIRLFIRGTGAVVAVWILGANLVIGGEVNLQTMRLTVFMHRNRRRCMQQVIQLRKYRKVGIRCSLITEATVAPPVHRGGVDLAAFSQAPHCGLVMIELAAGYSFLSSL